MVKAYYDIHNHTLYSNTRFTDAINSVKSLIWNAYKKGLAGIAITDHQSLSGHVVAVVAIKQLQKKHPDMFNHFRVTFGDEIYLVDRDKTNKARKEAKAYHEALAKNPKTNAPFHFNKFYHLILVAKNAHGYELLQKLNTRAWKDAFKYGKYPDNQQLRLPTYKDWLAKEMKNYRGDVVVSTACLGSELSNDILNCCSDSANYFLQRAVENSGVSQKTLGMLKKLGTSIQKQTKKKALNDINVFINYLTHTFGKENIYFEMMPSKKRNQKIVNKTLWSFSKTTGIKTIISTDSHYIDDKDEKAHQVFLQAESKTRSVYPFYHYAHLFKPDELKNFFSTKVLRVSVQNSLDLMNSIQKFSPAKHITSTEIKNAKDADTVNMKYKSGAWHSIFASKRAMISVSHAIKTYNSNDNK